VSIWLAACGGSGGNSVGDDDSDPTTGEVETTGDESSTGDDDAGVDESTGADTVPPEPEIIHVLEDVVFYDGYADPVDEPVPDGVVRHSNSLVAVRFTDAQRASIQSTLKIGVIIGALCDNYDRIGSVHLAIVPKGAPTYVPEEVQRIEVARFITPFMDMNKDPKTVPYQYDADDVVPILKDEELLAEHDLWFELSVFGVPYAAHTQIAGCAGRNDTQLGTLLLYTDSLRDPEVFDGVLPLAIDEPFNNYAEGASDELGTTRKTIVFELEEDAAHAQLLLITSNHGANAGGEEYVRRDHYVHVDGELVLQYKPGRETCEPFRKYNTQPNGIYGPSPRSDAQWQSFSNWCPGDVIDRRIISLGPVGAGAHEFVIDVPDATFVGGEGNFPLSLYLQARGSRP
jgi:hypothetical protein